MNKFFVDLMNQLTETIRIGKLAEHTVCTYTDTLITAMNPRKDFKENVCPEPHPCSLDASTIKDHKEHYENIVNCCQRHVCRLEAYCKSKSGKCRFGYPFQLEKSTRLEFIETKNSVKAEIHLKRYDPYLNMHNITTEQCWKGNTDMQIILDQHAAISYMVKYATKGEKAGSSLNELYRTVITQASDEDNPVSKLKSLMLKTVSGKRDLGQCEVSRLLFSGNLYSSTFTYVTQSLELKQSNQVKNTKELGDSAPITYKSLMDSYANRANNGFAFVGNFYQFTKTFKIFKSKY